MVFCILLQQNVYEHDAGDGFPAVIYNSKCMHEIIVLITGIAIVQLLLFAAFIAFTEYRRKRMLLLFLTANICFLGSFFLAFEFPPDLLLIRSLARILFISGYFFGPALYAYLGTIVIEPKLNERSIFKSAFILSGLQIIHVFITSLTGIKLLFLGQTASFYLTLALHVQIFYFLLQCARVIRNHRRDLQNIFSTTEKRDLEWVSLVIFAFLCMWVIDCMSMLINTFWSIPANIHPVVSFFSVGINFIFANVTILKGLKNPELFQNTSEAATVLEIEKTETPPSLEKLKQKLLSVMDETAPHLDPDITLPGLSIKTGINTKYLSQIINELLGKNFYEFINTYRVEEAKRMLVDLNSKEKTILEILYACGFNSKSVFNNVFKKETGMTPTEYRRTNSIIALKKESA